MNRQIKKQNTPRPPSLTAKTIFFLFSMMAISLSGCANRFRSDESSQPNHGDEPSARRQETPLQIKPSAKFKYAGLEFSVTQAAMFRGDVDVGGSAEVTVSVVDPIKEDVHIGDGQFELTLGNGSSDKQPFAINIGSRETKEAKIIFRVPRNSVWSGAKLTLDEEGKQSPSIPLEGEFKDPQFPITLTSGSTTTTKEPAMTYKIQSAKIDLDGLGVRAAIGKRYLNLTVRVSNDETESSGQFLPEFFRLLIDGQPTAADSTGDVTTIEPQGVAEYTMYYLIPEALDHVELEVGKPEIQATATIPIDLRSEHP